MIKTKTVYTVIEAEVAHSVFESWGMDSDQLAVLFWRMYPSVEIIDVEWFDEYFLVTYKQF